MKKEEFKHIWKSNFPEADPIGYELKWVYKQDRWFRIHSLPESKRYAETEEEYKMIFYRQNTIISDLIRDDTSVVLLFGRYEEISKEDGCAELTEFGEFIKIDTIDLHKTRPKEYNEECYYDIYVKEFVWRIDTMNNMLKRIADDEDRMMIIYPQKSRIINPYDGGVDLILESEIHRDFFKENISLGYQTILKDCDASPETGTLVFTDDFELEIMDNEENISC